MLTKEQIMELKGPGGFGNIDLTFAGFIAERSGLQDSDLLYLTAALASWAIRQGHSCCDLNHIGGRLFPPDSVTAVQQPLPSGKTMIHALHRAGTVTAFVPEFQAGSKPLILDAEGHLYLNRYYSYELLIAAELSRRAALPERLPAAEPGYLAGLSSRFRMVKPGDREPDYQQAAVYLAHSRNFSVITGGPGTGKTTVLTALLAWELEENPDIRILLCAPTGKAQSRMKESLAAEIGNLNCSRTTAERLSGLPCQTIDSMLKPIPCSPNYRVNRENPLPADLVVLDEVSMASLSLLGHLFQALRPETRLVLIGDKDQLAPVEAGAVLEDLIQSGTANVMSPEMAAAFEKQTGWAFPVRNDRKPLSGCIAELKINYRSRKAPVISGLASLMRRLPEHPDEADAVFVNMAEQQSTEFMTLPLPRPSAFDDALRQFMRDRSLTVESHPDDFFTPADMVAAAAEGTDDGLALAFELLDSFKILCAVRQGPYGVEHVNDFICRMLGLQRVNMPGMPLMIRENTPVKQLYNGDIGLVWQRQGERLPRVAFRCVRPDGSRGFRFLALPELPPYESVFAMTVHKSQGSGFRKVMIVLPPKDMPLLTRELIYTAVTRAERNVVLYALPEILRKTLKNKTFRYSGLAGRLTGD